MRPDQHVDSPFVEPPRGMAAESPEVREANRRAYESWRRQYETAADCRQAAAKDAVEASKRLAVALEGILKQAPDLSPLVARLLDGDELTDSDRASYAHRPELAPVVERAAHRFQAERTAWNRVIRRAEHLEAGTLREADSNDTLLFADDDLPIAVHDSVERRHK